MYRFGTLIRQLLTFVYPSTCCICHRRLLENDADNICTACLSTLPYTHWAARKDNPAEFAFKGYLPLVRATSFLKYMGGSEQTHLIWALKYYNRPEVGRYMAKLAAKELADTHFFDGIDAIIPVPLAKKRFQQRGYNQSYWIAVGLQDATGIRIEQQAVERHVANTSQTQLSAEERETNVQDIFRLKSPEGIAHRHLLLVDDVLTTGATLRSLAYELMKAGDVRFSIFTLAASHHLTTPPIPEGEENL